MSPRAAGDLATSPRTNPWQTHSVAIRDIRPEVPGVATYGLEFRDATIAAGYCFEPGQFNMLYLPGAGEIAISVSGDPGRAGPLAHTIREAGNVTGTLAKLKVGDTLGLRGPFGTAWPISECVGRDVLLVAGGIGLAPLRPAIYSLVHQPDRYGRLNLLYGARTPETLLYPEECGDWSNQGLTVQTTVDRSSTGWQGQVGVVTTLLDRLRAFDPRNAVVICCGPEVMMRFTVLAALGRGVPAERIWISMERNMQCAIGLCGHCQWGPEFVCKDGPVFRYDRIAPFLDVRAF